MVNSKNPNLVYHVTTEHRAEQCLSQGLFPYHSTEASPQALSIDALYDDNRPDSVVKRGVSRLSSVYAHPEYDNALERANGTWLNRAREKLAVLSIFVPDLRQAYVCEGMLVIHPQYTPEQYWGSFTTLESYRSQKRPVFSLPDNRPYSNELTNFLYFWPEVLLPGGVEPDRLSLVE